MRKLNFIAATVAVVSLCSAFPACTNSTGDKEKKEPVPGQSQMVERGNYLVATMGCDDCHSPKRMGAHGPELIPELRLSGYPASRPVQKPDSNAVKQGWTLMGADLTSAVGPWGMSFAANLTSDATGIGNWTEQNFLTAIKHGKSKGMENNRDILPPMPWVNYKKLTDEDLKCIFAYLKSTPPVANLVPAPKQLADFK